MAAPRLPNLGSGPCMLDIMRNCLLFLLAAVPLAAADLHFPPPPGGDWAKGPGWNGPALDKLLQFNEARRSTGLVILVNGKIAVERYWDPSRFAATAQFRFEKLPDGSTREDVASTQKSITAVLFGIARAKGLADFDTPVSKVLGEGWTRLPPDQERSITMRHLLTMTSGLTDDLKFEAAPGTRWRYNTPAYQKILPALAQATGKTANAMTREWLTGPLGMTQSEWRDRPQMPGLVGFITTARDLARFGLMVLAGGEWQGKRIVGRAYLDEALRPSQQLNPAYGFLWWLNGHPVQRAGGRRAGTLIPTAPKDVVAAQGALGRKVYVSRSLGLVAVRIGGSAEQNGEPDFNAEFWRLLTAAMPAR